MKSLVLCDDNNCEKVVELCQKYGLGIEIQGFYNPNQIDRKEEIIAMYKAKLPDNIEKHLHAPFWDLCLGSANTQIKDVTKFYFDYAYRIAEELKCDTVTIHQGFVPNTSYIDNWINRSKIFWLEFFETHKADIIMCMENLLEYDPRTFIEIIDGVNRSHLAVNLDIGHTNCNSKTPTLEWIKQLGERIKYVHIHDNFGTKDDHLGLGKGTMNIVEILNALNEYTPKAIWALECNTDDMEESIEYLITNGFIKRI